MLNVDICTDVAYHVHLMLIRHLSDQEFEGMPALQDNKAVKQPTEAGVTPLVECMAGSAISVQMCQLL